MHTIISTLVNMNMYIVFMKLDNIFEIMTNHFGVVVFVLSCFNLMLFSITIEQLIGISCTEDRGTMIIVPLLGLSQRRSYTQTTRFTFLGVF